VQPDAPAQGAAPADDVQGGGHDNHRPYDNDNDVDASRQEFDHGGPARAPGGHDGGNDHLHHEHIDDNVAGGRHHDARAAPYR
jgi:hypothetical protein